MAIPTGQLQTVISTAANQYANRPADERYPDMPSLIAAAEYDRTHSAERTFNLRDLTFAGANTDDNPAGLARGLYLQSPKGRATMSHWAFGQMARMVSAPAGYLRSLPPTIAADALNFGLKETAAAGETAILLVKANGGLPHVRSATSDSYGRVFDSPLYSEAQRMIFDRPTSTGQEWIAPPTWDGGTAGTWRGDRDSFIIRVDGGSIVNDPSVGAGKDGRMYRGVMIKNSEVGASALVIETVLFQFICGNLNLWGAMIDKRYRRRHVGKHALRDTLRELATLAREWSQRGASQDEAIIRALMSHELAHTAEGVTDELVKIGYTKENAIEAVKVCETMFDASPRSFWGIAQGTTKLSQSEAYQSDRLELDQLAALVMARGRTLVAA